jgi:peptidoglycan/LPS O-acetylase OafA/YrhL
VLAPFVVGRELGSAERLLLIVISIGLAWLTSRYIEQPARSRLLNNFSLPKFFGVMAATIALFGLVALPLDRISGVLVAADRAVLAERAQLSCFGAGA